jgi:hypothetical protein
MSVGFDLKNEKQTTKRVYYTGSSALKAGYCLCYNRDSNTGATTTSVDYARAREVEKPATANLPYFAGVVESGCEITGPGWIEIIEPKKGMLAEVWSDVSSTLGTTHLAITNGSYAVVANTTGTVCVGRAMQTIDTDTTNARVLAELSGVGGALVTQTGAAVTKVAGSTTGGVVALAGLTAAVGGVGATANKSAFSGDMAILAKAINAVIVDQAAVIAALKTNNLM